MKIHQKLHKAIICLFAFAISILSGAGAFAAAGPFELVDLSIADKSAGVEGDALLDERGRIINNIVFHHVGDYVEYLLELKNIGSDTLTITGISDDNTNPYMTYSYDGHAEEEIVAGASLMLRVKATYANEVTDLYARWQNVGMKISINYNSDEISGSFDILVPDTGKNTNLFANFIEKSNPIVIGSIFGLTIVVVIICVAKRKNKLAAVICAAAFALMVAPSSIAETANVNTVSGGSAIDFSANFGLYDKLAISYTIDGVDGSQAISYGATVGDLTTPERQGYTFARWRNASNEIVSSSTTITGDLLLFPDWTMKIANLSVGCQYCGGDYPIQNGLQYGPKLWYTSLKNQFSLGSTTVDLFTRAAEKPSDEIIASAWNVATNASAYPVYLWYDTDANTLYWWSEAAQVNLPAYSKYAFYQFPVKKFDLNGISAVNTRELEGFFLGSKAQEVVFGAGFNTSNVGNMSSMFYGLSNLTSVDLENLDTHSAYNFSWMFNNAGLTAIDFSNHDFSNGYNFQGMFANTTKLANIKLPAMDVSGADLSNMFDGASTISVVDLSVMTMDEYSCPEIKDMFNGATNLTTVYASDSLASWSEYDCVWVESGDPENENVRDFRIFDGADKLEGGLGSKYSVVRPHGYYDVTEYSSWYDPADESFLFRFDGGSSNPGMLTRKQ